MLESAILVALVAVALWSTVFVLYQFILGCLYFVLRDKPIPAAAPLKRFAVIIPAHNEEMVIEAALESWKRVLYPAELFTVYVVADNCTDRTEEIARLHGAVSVRRQDNEKRGKGYALEWALGELPLHKYDAIVFVDADTTVSAQFLVAMNKRLVNGAEAIQGFDGVLNPDESWLTRLIQITNVLKNLLFNHAKAKLGLSVQLMGTGMCFDRKALKRVGWKAFSIGEDGEQFAYMAEAGIRVDYEPAALNYAQEAKSLRQAYTQRIRWAAGRMQLVGLGARLVKKGLLRRDVRLIDAGLTFLVPSYVELGNVTLAGFVVSVLTASEWGGYLSLWFVGLIVVQGLYFFMGMALSGVSVRVMCALALIPLFLLWRLAVNVSAISHIRRDVWVRTARE